GHPMLNEQNNGALLSLVKGGYVVYRHGDRSPLSTYPTDPHKAAAWPHGFQQLSEVGILQQKALGKFLRERYAGFLSPSYKPQEIYVRSTDYDRTIMSAQANLMGLYPNSHPEIPWKPVPIHTVPAKIEELKIHFHIIFHYI
uniref:Acid phosphatase 2, lysosomal n=1 Tax=Pseudonaja textilis TaxID=8673 RepID=A0A670ZG42_PSETE